MGSSSDRLFHRQRTLHQILGAGFVADVMLWRRKDVAVGIMVVTLAAWVMFELSGYTLLSFASSVFFLLFAVLFLWAKSAAILNRPAPPLPHFYLTEETANAAAAVFRDHVNTMLSISEGIALGRDSRMFIKVALGLLLVSTIGSLANFLTFGYIGLVMVLTVPALYERYENHIDKYALTGYRKVQLLYSRFDQKCITAPHNWVLELEKQKLN